MKYIEAFRDRHLARRLADAIRAEIDPARRYRLMEFCGGHTHAIFRHGVPDWLPDNVQFVHGPGCPVCVLPVARLDQAIALVEEHDVILCTYGDLLRVPASGRRSLMTVRAEGGDIRMVYSVQDALRIARAHPDRPVVFFAIGFETTTPPTAVALRQARDEGLENFSVFCNHVLTPAAIRAILADPDAAIDGFLGPAHVSAIIGSQPYEALAEAYRRPVVIAGFEPLDILQATRMLIRLIDRGCHAVENEYTRVVTREGNRKAQALVETVFVRRRHFEWRGLGQVPDSALAIRPAFADWDAERRFPVQTPPVAAIKGCECPAILRGRRKPTDCRLFGTACLPEHPLGACMVSSEGACAAYWRYGRVASGSRESIP